MRALLWLFVASASFVRLVGGELSFGHSQRRVSYQFAAEDVRAIQKLRRATGLRIWQECSNLDDVCSSCSHRIGCSSGGGGDMDKPIRITELKLNNSGLVGSIPKDWRSEPKALSALSVLDVSSNSLLDSSQCLVDDSVCLQGLCAPHTLACGGRSKRRELQNSLILSDPAELAAWQSFYDATGGDNWRNCGGPLARANPCDPLACTAGDIDRYVLCAVIGGRTTLLEIRMVDNRMRGTLDDSSLKQLTNLRLLWITNSEQATGDNINLIFAETCFDIQRCFLTTQMVCNFENTGLQVCGEIPTSAPTKSPTRHPTTFSPTDSPTKQPTTLAPTTLAPTTLRPTKAPTTAAPTSRAPTSKAPTKAPSLSPTGRPTIPTASPALPTKSPTRVTSSPTIAPTRFPTMRPAAPALPKRDFDAWNTIFTVLNGVAWDFCDLSNTDPCNFPTTGCEVHTRITCRLVSDGTLRISEMFLSMNNIRGVVPVDAFNVLGPWLDTMDLSVNTLTMSGSCVSFDFCYTRTRCNLAETGLVLCPQGSVTPSPTIYTPLEASELVAWQRLYDSLDGPNWTGGCSASRNEPCLFLECAQCIVTQGKVFITSILLGGKNLVGDLDDRIFWELPRLDRVDFSNNELSADDCIRAEVCYRSPSSCDFSNSGVTLCSDSLNTLAPALSIRPQLSFPDLIAFYWLYDDLNGPQWSLPSSCADIGVDPCVGCPNRIQCGLDPADGTKLIIQRILLANSNLRGIVPTTPIQRLMLRGLTELDLSGSGNQLALPTGASCLSIPECYNGTTSCSLSDSGVALCPPPFGSPPTLGPTTPTRQPTFNPDSPCRTSGGLVPEGIACASPFRYASIQFSGCISFTDRPPLSDKPFNLPRIPTDFWCPTVSQYNLDTKDSWGFCDCMSSSPTTTFQTKPPFSVFTPAPTSRPTTPTTRRPTTLSPTQQGATQRPSKAPTVSAPSFSPTTSRPSRSPTARGTAAPTRLPTVPPITQRPTSQSPTKSPTLPQPTKSPTTSQPSKAPTGTKSPTVRPGTTQAPTAPTTTDAPVATGRPSHSPTRPPDPIPTKVPTARPTTPTTTLGTSSPVTTNLPSMTPTRRFTQSPTRSPTLRPTNPTGAPTRSPTFSQTQPTTRQPSKSPTVAFVGTNPPSEGPTVRPTSTNAPSTSPTVRPTSSAPSTSPTRRSPTTAVPSRAPEARTASPFFVASVTELDKWQEFYDNLGGPNWSQCADTRDNPCKCSGRNQVFVTCARPSGRRRRQLQDDVRITAISLPNNNVVGTVPAPAVQSLSALQSLDLQGNQVQLAAGSTCETLSVCSRVCHIGQQCDTSTPAPTGSRGGGGGSDPTGIIVAVVIIILLLMLLTVLFCVHRQCPERLPKACLACFACACCAGASKGAMSCCAKKDRNNEDEKTRALMPREDDIDEEYGDPAFSKMARFALERSPPTLAEQRPEGHSHFSLMRGESLPALKDNATLSGAKLNALKQDEAARIDVADLGTLLENIGLGHRLQKFNDAGVHEVYQFMCLKDDKVREIGLTLGERVKVKRAIAVRTAGLPDPVFGKV